MKIAMNVNRDISCGLDFTFQIDTQPFFRSHQVYTIGIHAAYCRYIQGNFWCSSFFFRFYRLILQGLRVYLVSACNDLQLFSPDTGVNLSSTGQYGKAVRLSGVQAFSFYRNYSVIYGKVIYISIGIKIRFSSSQNGTRCVNKTSAIYGNTIGIG